MLLAPQSCADPLPTAWAYATAGRHHPVGESPPDPVRSSAAVPSQLPHQRSGTPQAVAATTSLSTLRPGPAPPRQQLPRLPRRIYPRPSLSPTRYPPRSTPVHPRAGMPTVELGGSRCPADQRGMCAQRLAAPSTRGTASATSTGPRPSAGAGAHASVATTACMSVASVDRSSLVIRHACAPTPAMGMAGRVVSRRSMRTTGLWTGVRSWLLVWIRTIRSMVEGCVVRAIAAAQLKINPADGTVTLGDDQVGGDPRP